MSDPKLELIPLRAAIRKDKPTELDVLIRITPSPPTDAPARPPLNLGLVLDRSGSMAEGRKMPHAIAAAVFAVEQLLPTDRVSVTIFDAEVETIVPNQVAANKSGIAARLKAVVPRGSTALHGGWAEGAHQVEKNLAGAGLNRVLLLSDGQANVGLTAPDAVATEVSRLKDRGVGTTTLGVGDDYNEDLMQAMARSGDGNYYFIEDPRQLADLFQTELTGLIATQGTDVRLRIEPRDGVEVKEVVNELDRADDGSIKLANLIAGMPQDIIIHLVVPPRETVTDVLHVRLQWKASGKAGESVLAASLILPAVPGAEYDALAENAEVLERAALQRVGQMKRHAYEAMERGDYGGTVAGVKMMGEYLQQMPAGSESVMREISDVGALQADLEAGQYERMIKRGKFQHYARSRGRGPASPPPPPAGEPPTGGA